MAQSYIINLTDPSEPGFSVSEYTSNGLIFPIADISKLSPTATSAATSLVLYGKGHPQWGERLQENMVHMLENFSGGTEPSKPISGQLWYARYVHVRSSTGQWYVWSDDTEAWAPFTASATVGVPLPGSTDGAYWFDATTSTLYRSIVQANHPMSPTTIKCVWTDITTFSDPNAASFKPHKALKVYNGIEWITASNPIVGSVSPLADLGKLWYDTSAGELKIYNGTAWEKIGAKYLPLNGGTMTAPLNMGSNRITNLANPSSPTSNDAVSASWVTALVGTTASSLDDLSDTDLQPTIINRSALVYDAGTGMWRDDFLAVGDLAGALISTLELNYLSGVTGAIQTQLDSKLSRTVSGTMLVDFSMGGKFISGVPVPTALDHAVNKQYVDDEITAAIGGVGGTDTFLVSGILDTLVGSATEGFLTLTLNDATTIAVAGFAVQGHTHTPESITLTPSPGSLLSQLTATPTNVDEAIYSLDQVIRRRTSPRRGVFTTTAPTTTFTSIPEYEVGNNKLMVFLNGVKQICGSQGFNVAEFTNLPDATAPTYLNAGISNYTFDINVDGGGAVTVTIDGALAQTYFELLTEINNQLTTLTIPAVAVSPDGNIEFYSNTHGVGSSVVLANTGANPLFSSILIAPGSPSTTNFSGFTGNIPGTDFAYNEVGNFGDISTQVTFGSAVATGQTVEFIVLADSGVF